MSAVIEKRITKLENELLPKPGPAVTVLIEPAPNAEAPEIAAYLDQIAQKRPYGEQVIVVRFFDSARLAREDTEGVCYVRTEWGENCNQANSASAASMKA